MAAWGVCPTISGHGHVELAAGIVEARSLGAVDLGRGVDAAARAWASDAGEAVFREEAIANTCRGRFGGWAGWDLGNGGDGNWRRHRARAAGEDQRREDQSTHG